ncbi:MAG: glycoside hydrolase family 3 [Bacteroidetes bacterium]|nr:glycoside hydrolase family 3 [Bacteroidota bacterium]
MRIKLVDLSKYSFFFIGLILTAKLLAPPHTLNQKQSKTWAEMTFDSMTVDERLAQLFMIEVRPTYGPKHLANVEKAIRDHQVGGVIFFKGNPTEQVRLTNQFQALSKTKMLVAIDGEWGLAMRLSNTISYPYQLGLGSISDNKIIYEMGREVGRQCKRMGIHVNFAPVIDVNNNPNNPVINYRSFGEDPMKVSEKGWAYAKGMQDEGIIACAKHFPGHGDTDVDSHKDLPVINHDIDRLKVIEFKPFEYLIDKGVMSVMTAHLFIPAIDSSKNIAMSISDKAINGLLRREFGFKGLSFTDALNMQGVAKYHPDGELELKALMAGNDILLAPGDIPKAKKLIKEAMADGRLSEDYVWGKVHKILNFKHVMGLNEFTPISEHNVIKDLNNTSAQYVNYQLVEQEMCLLNDTNSIIPIRNTSDKSILSIAIGNGTINTFQKELKKLSDAKLKTISKNASGIQFDALKDATNQYDLVIVSLHNTSKYPPNFGITNQTAKFLNHFGRKSNVILVDFGNP